MAIKGTKISHARFVVGPFPALTMASLAGGLRTSMYGRIARGLNVNDAPAKPLKPTYAKGKQRKGRSGLRDWIYKIRTLDRMSVLTATENRAVIGFDHPLAAAHAHFQNMRERQFGVSPTDRSALVSAVHETVRQGGVITVKQLA
jgi:hypothetical protein